MIVGENFGKMGKDEANLKEAKAKEMPEFVPNEGLSPLEWLSITEKSGKNESYYDVRRRETFAEKLFKNPIIPIGK